MKPLSLASLLSLALLFFGCAISGKRDYIPPEKPITTNSKVIKSSKEKVWTKAIPALGKSFYQINNIDKSSGLLNLSFTADPSKYVDCGRLQTEVKNARGPRKYDVALADKSANYEMFENGTIWAISRNLSLEGRINLIFESISASETRVTTNTKYVLTMNNRTIGGVGPNYQPYDILNNYIATFDLNSEGKFNNVGTTICYANGKLEEEVLGLIK